MKVKRKGAYWYPESLKEYEGWWNKDFSMMIVQKAASRMLIENISPATTLLLSSDKFDFMLRYKATGSSKIYIDGVEQSKTMRYYVSTRGGRAYKKASPTGKIGEYKRANKIPDHLFDRVMSEVGPGVWDARIHNKKKTKYEIVETAIESGRLIKCCNNANDFDWSDVDFDYYLKEIEKLKIGV